MSYMFILYQKLYEPSIPEPYPYLTPTIPYITINRFYKIFTLNKKL